MGSRGPRPIPFKQKQINPSKIACICLILFFRIGTYQWVTANSSKEIQPCLRTCATCLKRVCRIFRLPPAPREARADSAEEVKDSADSDFSKRIVAESVFQAPVGAEPR